MEKALGNILTSHNGLVAELGKRITPLLRDGYPSLIFEKTGADQDISMSGAKIGPIRSTFLITIHSKSVNQSRSVANMVKEAVKGPYDYILSPKIQLSTLDSDREEQLFEPDIVEVALEYTFYHN